MGILGAQGSVWGAAGKGGGTEESGYPGCTVLPCEQHFGVGGKTLQSMKAAPACVCVAQGVCLTAVRAVTAGSNSEPS